MSKSAGIDLPNADATTALGARLASILEPGLASGVSVWLQGELGAGKTSLVRGLLRSLGHSGRVPSPSYTLIEPYDLACGRVYHVDLYRLRSPQEAYELGLAELPAPGELLVIEWPEKAAEALAPPDLQLTLSLAPPGRRAEWCAARPAFRKALSSWGRLQPSGLL